MWRDHGPSGQLGPVDPRLDRRGGASTIDGVNEVEDVTGMTFGVRAAVAQAGNELICATPERHLGHVGALTDGDESRSGTDLDLILGGEPDRLRDLAAELGEMVLSSVQASQR
jgi:hypothetical protein